MLYPQPNLNILKKDQDKDTEANGETKNPKFEISPFKVTSSIQGDLSDPIMLLNKTPRHKGLKRRPASIQKNLPPEVRDDPMRNNLSPIKAPQRESSLPAGQESPKISPLRGLKASNSSAVEQSKKSPPPLTDLISIDGDISSRESDFEYEEYSTVDNTTKVLNEQTHVRATKLTSFDGIVRKERTPEPTARTQSLRAESHPPNDFVLHTPLRGKVRTFQDISNDRETDDSNDNTQRLKRSRTSSNTFNSAMNTVAAIRGSISTQKEYPNGQLSDYDVSDTISKAQSFIHSKKLEKTRLGRPSRRVISNDSFLSDKTPEDTYVSMNSKMLEFDSSSNNQNGEGELLSGLDDEKALNKQNLESLDESTRAKQLDTWGLEKWRKLAGVLKLYGVTKNEELLDPKFIQSELGCEANELVARAIILVKWKELKSLRKMQRSINRERNK